jgi:hypothetical protein
MISSDRDLERRNKLRNEFWSTIDSYLDDLECPKEGGNLLEATNGGKAYWRQDPSLRRRVVYWIISCATSELYTEKLDPKEQVAAAAAAVAPAVNPMERTPATKKLVLLPELDPSVFPLGFSTGDNQVDQLLIILRMNFLQQVEQEQHQYNQLLADSILEMSNSRDKRQAKTMSKKSGRQRGRR